MKFRELRKRQGFKTTKEFAEKIEFKTSRVFKWEAGISKPKLNDIPHIAKILKVSEKKVLECFK